MTEEAAIALLLESGCAVERKGYHVYRSASNEYIILFFNCRGDMVRDSEESFTALSDAVAKFVQRTKL